MYKEVKKNEPATSQINFFELVEDSKKLIKESEKDLENAKKHREQAMSILSKIKKEQLRTNNLRKFAREI